jgi:hypothetical protein
MIAERRVSSTERNLVPSLPRSVNPPFGFQRPVTDRRPLWSGVKLRNVSGVSVLLSRADIVSWTQPMYAEGQKATFSKMKEAVR